MSDVLNAIGTCQSLTEALFESLDSTLEVKESQATARQQYTSLLQQLSLVEEKLIAMNVHHVATVPPTTGTSCTPRTLSSASFSE